MNIGLLKILPRNRNEGYLNRHAERSRSMSKR